MTEHHANLLGTNRSVAECEMCGEAIRLDDEEDEFCLFARGFGDEQETTYEVAPLCSVPCGREYGAMMLSDADRRGSFFTPEERGDA